MALTDSVRDSVNFKAELHRGSRVWVSRLIRWQFKIESNWVLKAAVHVAEVFAHEIFYVR